MYIDGQWINAKNHATFPVFNPANGEKIADLPNGDREDTVNAVDAAQRAFDKELLNISKQNRAAYRCNAGSPSIFNRNCPREGIEPACSVTSQSLQCLI